MKLLATFSLILAIFSVWATEARAQGEAFLSISPQSGTFTVENTFDVSVFLNTGGKNVNAVKIDLKFDPRKLQVVTPAKGISAVGEWIFPPSFSNKTGEITLQGGFPGQGINTSEGLVSVIVFRVISLGETEVNFLDSSKVLSEKGTNILNSFNRGVYRLIPSPSRGPRIFSETHPNQAEWYKNPNPSFSWEEIIGAEGYSFQLNDDPFGEPNNVIDTESASVSFEEVEEGGQYFHLKAKKAGVWGGTSHFKIMVDKTPPQEFKPYLASLGFIRDNYLLVYFDTQDSLSGMNYYQVRVADYTNPENIIWSGWIQEKSPFKLTVQGKKVFQVFIRAFDQAGNFQEEEIRVNIINSFLIVISGGVQIKGILLPWWLISVLIIMILSGAGYLLFRRIKTKPQPEKVDLPKEIREAEKEIEDVRKAKKKLRKMRLLEEKGGEEWQRLKRTLDKTAKPSEEEKE
ncbi:MAG: hypothetical protein Q8P63_03160 [Candidatus Nealsonbacteria bacterium]|nr:hypothetical protein [Candidatus Nealsonbacteria bacterium]